MEKRIGTVIIYVGDRQSAPQLNEVLSRHADIIVCRQGFPRQDYSLISVVFEGTTDRIGSLTGQLGRIEGINVKSALLPIEHPCGNPHPSASPAGDASSVTPTRPSFSASPAGDASSVTDIINQLHP